MRGTSAHVRPGKDRKPHRVHVLLQGSLGHHLGGLAQTGVDHLHAGIPQGARHHFGAAVVPIQAGFGDQDSDLLFWHSPSVGVIIG